MKELRYTLLSDGSSDRMLLPLLDWLLQQHSSQSFRGDWADLARLPRPPVGLKERVSVCLELFPCELLFIHRDAERVEHATRCNEIKTAIEGMDIPPVICVVPVRMQEAWFLFSEESLRQAAGNPSATLELQLPSTSRVENLPDPKEILFEALRVASGLRGRRLQQFPVRARAHRLATLIEDFSPLMSVPAFALLSKEIERTLGENGWK